MALTATSLQSHPDLHLVASGKVREVYELKQDSNHLLFVATDRISAFDVVLGSPIPNKGAVLTLLSKFWFELLKTLTPDVSTHFVSMGLPRSVKAKMPVQEAAALEHRTMLVKRLEMLPLESICRGYITGSAWTSYQRSCTVNGIQIPPGLEESDRFSEVLWTPSTKALNPEDRDENISPEQAAKLVGPRVAQQVESISRRVYLKAAEYAASRGIIIADTKLEFGLDHSVSPPAVVLCDEVLTPDSSRFWSAKDYVRGRPQSSLDKEPLRRWLVESGRKGNKGVELPGNIINETEQRYKDAYERLSERKISEKVR